MTDPHPLCTSFDRAAGRSPDSTAVIDQQGTRLTHAELVEQAASAAAGLTELGLAPGRHLGVFLPNRSSWPVVALAAARAGIGILGLNTRFRQAELNHLLAVADVDVVLVASDFLGIDGPALMGDLDRSVQVIVDGAAPPPAGAVGWRELLAAEPGPVTGGPDHPLIGFTTSGTTGFPKVAMHDQRQALAHLRAVIDGFGLARRTVTLVPLPFCGAFGWTAAMPTLLAGGTVVAHETWDPDTAAEAIGRHGVTFCSCSDDMIIDLVASERFDPDTTWTSGGFADFTNAGPQAVAAAERASRGRTRLTGLYGSSEGFALMSCWPPDASLEERSRNGGHLVGRDMAVRCCDPETGEALPHGQAGELQFRGPNLITRYLANDEATAAAFTIDGWYRSGDLGTTIGQDHRGHEGFVYLSRLGDSLRLRGFLCDPAEIERHLERDERVDLAQVVGVRRAGVGDVAVAFVRPTEGAAVDESSLLAHCRSGLANYKRPERIEIVDEFPVTDGPNGVKIRKVELRHRAAELLAADGGPGR